MRLFCFLTPQRPSITLEYRHHARRRAVVVEARHGSFATALGTYLGTYMVKIEVVLKYHEVSKIPRKCPMMTHGRAGDVCLCGVFFFRLFVFCHELSRAARSFPMYPCFSRGRKAGRTHA